MDKDASESIESEIGEVPSSHADTGARGNAKLWRRVLSLILGTFSDYVSLDLRAIAAFRIGLGIVLLYYGALRLFTATEFLSDQGMLPSHYNLFNPLARSWSILNAFPDPLEVKVVLILFLIVFSLFTLGIGGRWITFFSLVASVSLLSRNLFIENGGHVVLNLLLVWALFLPLDARLSYRAFRRKPTTLPLVNWLSEELRPGAFTGIGALGIVVSCMLIYWFNFLSKTGETWHSGSAVHYTLWLSTRAFIGAFWLRQWCPAQILKTVSFFVLAIEGIIPVLLISPILICACRRIACVLIFVLHLGIALCINLGPFSWAMCCFGVLLFPSRHSKCIPKVWMSARGLWSSLRFWGVVLLGCLLIYAQIVQSTFTYRLWMRLGISAPPPPWTYTLMAYLRIPQNWHMFSTDAPDASSHIVRVGVRQGMRYDLDTGREFSSSPHSLNDYFEKPLGLNHLRIEADTRFILLNGDYFPFFQRYLSHTYPGYEKYELWEILRKSPRFGERRYTDDATGRMLWEVGGLF